MSDTPISPASPGQDEPELTPSGAPIYRYENMEPAQFELAGGDDGSIAAISEHIERHLGPVSGVFHEILSDKVHLDVHFVAPSADFPFHALITSGMSDRPMTVPPEVPADEAARFAELCILLPSTWNLPTDPEEMREAFEDEDVYWPIYWLKMLARLPHDYGTWLGFGHTIPNGEDAEPFADDTELGCMMLIMSPNLPEAFQTLVVSPEKTVHFYTLCPIYREEMELKMEQGVDALFDRFDEYGITDIVDLDRPNVALA
ncbi:suppressor of fused domain protein [Hymenobacter lapidiphilus]|uniref:suppressor of fused domain protein n=1 Tax=Hymenobacter sp. CCM 8763 TaxID=2303334 RepID=UPI000E354CFE|nr:suppressor of fused domain protein [Hymenobacter sp. CCM 8763]RFP66167.1 suppressor of fused domain protein [Hymenobacter sp. CCM 8763]